MKKGGVNKWVGKNKEMRKEKVREGEEERGGEGRGGKGSSRPTRVTEEVNLKVSLSKLGQAFSQN